MTKDALYSAVNDLICRYEKECAEGVCDGVNEEDMYYMLLIVKQYFEEQN